MSVERAEAYSPEMREGMYTHDTEGHEVEDVLMGLADKGIPIERATVEQDEKEGKDYRIGPVWFNVTIDHKKYEGRLKAAEEEIKKNHFDVTLPVYIPKPDPEKLRHDPAAQEAVRTRFWNSFVDELKTRLPQGVATAKMRQITRLINENQTAFARGK